MSTRYTEITASGKRYRLDRDRKGLFEEGARLHPLTPQNMQLLEFFVSRPSHDLVTRNEIFDHLYRGTDTSNQAVDLAIKSLRNALGPGFVVTDNRKGWRLAADIRHFEEISEEEGVVQPHASEDAPSPASGNPQKTSEESAQNILSDIRDISETLSDDSSYFDNLFTDVERSLSERRIMLETWTHSFGLGDSQPRQNYSARRGYDLGWCEVGGSWHLVVKEIEIHTNYETFLGYKYNESFEISKTPLLEAPQALKQMASVHMAELLAEIRLKLKKLSELRGEVASL